MPSFIGQHQEHPRFERFEQPQVKRARGRPSEEEAKDEQASEDLSEFFHTIALKWRI